MYHLLKAAEKLSDLGYKIGLASDKNLVGRYGSEKAIHSEWNGISLILDGIVCVDFDTEFYDLGFGNDLPPTLKDKSPRGHHLFYRLKSNWVFQSRVNWKPKVDLLVRSKKVVKYGGRSKDLVTEHVLVAPTPGYTKIYPDITPPCNQLSEAPDWLMLAIEA